MKFIIKLHPEITIKSKSVRKRFTKILESNIRNIFKPYGFQVGVRNHWDKLEMSARTEDPADKQAVIEQLQRIPGIEQILEVRESTFTDLDDIYQQVKAVWHDKLKGKSFAVRVKRRGNHEFTSPEIGRYVGGGLNQFCETGGVSLSNPDITVNLEVEHDRLFMVDQRLVGLGGFPIPTQDDVLSLMSGGFDSGVASYQMIRRGARTHYCFFRLGGEQHEIGVKQVSHYLWQRYGASHKVKFITVDFAPIVSEILEKVENSQMGVVLKRMMLRVATRVAEHFGISALVTGESLGQVSSQTLANLSVIDKVTDMLVLRPLICADKQEIINTAKAIGTEDFARTMPEYCGVISKKPTVRAVMEKVQAEEQNFDMTLLDQALENVEVMDIRRIAEMANEEVREVETVSQLSAGSVVLDIRSREEQEEAPLLIDNIEVQHIPFFKLATTFGDLDQSHDYFLYCDRGVMSKLQALLLHEQGYSNVSVYRRKA
ncbi:tRNA uracil 4-sulfurtransferase ThiI [Neptunicella sp. SCSIO 80796]|uniref:tRNA uracil 4-sulfurtransferase ThiI n=1 Tax=Neptunicella plasticusilytica TaxID=3117012 RepID=UPI003A4D56CB